MNAATFFDTYGLFPWLNVCLTTYAMWWLVPTLAAVSKAQAAAHTSPHLQALLRAAHRTQGAKARFLMLKEGITFKAKIVKYIWIMWPGGFCETSHLLASAVGPFQNAPVLNRHNGNVSIHLAKQLGLSDMYWVPLLHLLTRIAVIMNYSGMRNTHLYAVFTARMDVLFKELHRTYVYTPQRKLLFSQYIDAILHQNQKNVLRQVGGISFDTIWVGAPDMRCASTNVFHDMQRVWWAGKQGTHFATFLRLPWVIQSATLLLAIFFKCYRVKSQATAQRIERLVSTYRDLL